MFPVAYHGHVTMHRHSITVHSRFDHIIQTFLLKVYPKFAHKLRYGYRVRISSDYPQYKHSIIPKIVVDKPLNVLLADVTLEKTEVTHDVLTARASTNDTQQPCNQRSAGDKREKNIPKPKKQKYLFVEEIDRQDALYRITMNRAKTTDFQVAHGRARKPVRHC